MSIEKHLLSAIHGKLDEDLNSSKDNSNFTHQLKAALRKLHISEEEQERFMIDIEKYADTIDFHELRTIPKDKVLPHLLNCIWRAQVRSTKSESEFTSDLRSKQEEEDSDGEYETIDEDGEGLESASQGKRKSSSMAQGQGPQDGAVQHLKAGSSKSHGQGQGQGKAGVQKYKLLLDNVAPFYLEGSEIPIPIPGSVQLQGPAPTTAETVPNSNSNSNSYSNTLSSALLSMMNENPLDRNSKSSQRRFSRKLWRHIINHMEPEYPLPTLILKKHQYIKREEPRNLGPGTYDPHFHECQKGVRLRQTRGQMYSCVPRFAKELVKTDVPHAGAYGNPQETYQKLLNRLKGASKVPMMQSGPCNVRGGTFKTMGSALGPGEYSVKSSIQQLLEKHAGNRGPYDCFSQEDRFDIPHGYFKKPKMNLEPGQYGIIGSMKQELFNRYNTMKGRLSKLPRDQKSTGERITVVSPMWPTDEDIKKPGPGTYDNDKEPKYNRSCWSENYWAFNTSKVNCRPDAFGDYDNAPTRYRPEIADRKYCAAGCGFRSNFKSKSQRLDPKTSAVLSERLRPKDLPPWEKYQKDDDDC